MGSVFCHNQRGFDRDSVGVPYSNLGLMGRMSVCHSQRGFDRESVGV